MSMVCARKAPQHHLLDSRSLELAIGDHARVRCGNNKGDLAAIRYLILAVR